MPTTSPHVTSLLLILVSMNDKMIFTFFHIHMTPFLIYQAQPNLLVSFTTSLTPLEDNASVPVHLSDREIYTIPPFCLENDLGPSGLGLMERLQIVSVELPGLSDEILFDTDELAQALEEEEEEEGDRHLVRR